MCAHRTKRCKILLTEYFLALTIRPVLENKNVKKCKRPRTKNNAAPNTAKKEACRRRRQAGALQKIESERVKTAVTTTPTAPHESTVEASTACHRTLALEAFRDSLGHRWDELCRLRVLRTIPRDRPPELHKGGQLVCAFVRCPWSQGQTCP